MAGKAQAVSRRSFSVPGLALQTDTDAASASNLPGEFTCYKGTPGLTHTTVGWTLAVSDQLEQLNQEAKATTVMGLKDAREAGAEGAPDHATVGQKPGRLPSNQLLNSGPYTDTA